MKLTDFMMIMLHPWWPADKVIEMLKLRREAEWGTGLKAEDWLIEEKHNS